MRGGKRTAKPGKRYDVCLSMMHGGEISFLKAVEPPRYHLKNDGDDIEPDKRHFLCCLPGSFLFAAARVPLAGLRKENGRMKINYTFANGESSEVEVNEEIGTFILGSRREEENLGRKERYHCYSLDAAEFEGEDMADCETPETGLMGQFDREHIAEALGSLSEVQRRRILLLAEGLSVREIARREGKEIKTVRESIDSARKKFKKFF